MMIIKTNFKKVSLAAIVCFMASFAMQAQNGFCDPLDQNSITGTTGPGCTGTAVDNVLGNWGTINASVGYSDTGSINGAGDIYLDILDGGCSNGGSFVYNNGDYNGNYLAMVQDEGCFCFDIKTFHIQVGTLTPNTLRLYDGPNPLASTLSATFVMNGDYDVSRGWVRICAPIIPSDGVNVPSNADGQWIMNTGGAAAWDTLITNINSIGYYVDVAGGTERFGLDNICISQECDSDYNVDEPTKDGAYCCDSENYIENGNFEYGNVAINSDYTQDVATLPAQYNVTNDASLFGASVTDHSFCADDVQYASNDMFLLVNGNTNQAAGDSSVIWSQYVINLEQEKEYRFCGNFKNMPQCTFDVKPTVIIETSNGYSHTATIDVDPNDPCAWQLEGFCFTGDGKINISITLIDGVQGDGNDLAIDDLSVTQLEDPNLNITVQHQGDPQMITGSINTIDTVDDVLPYDQEICDRPFYWYVLTVDSFNGGNFSIDFSQPYGWGNDTGYSIFVAPASGPTPWDLTTTYPFFPFAQDTMYIIGLVTPSCCEDCVDDGFTYQLTYNGHAAEQTGTLSEADKQGILDMLGEYDTGDPTTTPKSTTTGSSNGLSLFPNPGNDKVTVRVTEGKIITIDVLSISGILIKTVSANHQTQSQLLDTAALDSGMYLVRVLTENGNELTKKLIIE